MAAQSKVLAGRPRPTASRTRRSCSIDIDRDRASALGVSFDNINAVLSTALGSAYVNDFPNAGRLQRVVVQADAPDRMQPDDLLRLNVLNNQGKPVPMAALATTRWVTGPIQTIRYNGYPTMRIAGDAAPGYSTGDAMDEMERLAGQLPAGFAFEWTGQSREERLSGSTATMLLGFSMLAVFLCLSALYESWSIPFAVLLAVPLGVLGAVLGATLARHAERRVLQGRPDHRDRPVGEERDPDHRVREGPAAAGQGPRSRRRCEAVHLRFRPILMTSIAFILGVLPLVVSSGAGSASQRAIGTGVMGGMITATLLAIFFVPVFFVVVRRIFKGARRATARRRRRRATDAGARRCRRHAGRRPCHAVERARASRASRCSRSPGGCTSLIPRYERPAAPVAADLRARDRRRPPRRGQPRPRPTSSGSASSPIRACKRLIELALAQQPRPARRGAQHRAGARALPGAARRRAADASASARPRRASRRDGTASANAYAVGLAVTSYELDFFGRVRNLSEAALAQYLATEEARKAVQISLDRRRSPTTYLSLLADDELLRVTRQTLATREDSTRLTKLRFDNGASSELDYRQAESLLEGARVDAGPVAAPARARRERAACCWSASRCRPTCRRRCRSTPSSSRPTCPPACRPTC